MKTFQNEVCELSKVTPTWLLKFKSVRLFLILEAAQMKSHLPSMQRGDRNFEK